jgi:hypothetical protein
MKFEFSCVALAQAGAQWLCSAAQACVTTLDASLRWHDRLICVF